MFLSIANHLWQSTLFAGVVAALCYLLRADGAHLRYRLWWIASVKFLVPFAALTTLGGWLGLRIGITGPLPGAWSNTMAVIARPFEAATWNLSPWLLLLPLWGAGALALIGIRGVRAARLRRVLQSAQRDRFALMDGRRRVPVYRTEARIEPGVVGIWRDALLLPAGIEKRLSDEQLQAVIAHELCHVRRRDNLTAAVHMVVEILFWFFPVIWWIGTRLVDERERACDEMVVALGFDRETYAESILDVCEHYAASPLRCAAGIGGSDLKRRITQIMRYEGMKTLKPTKRFLLTGTAVAAIAVPLLAGFALQTPVLAQATGQQGPPPITVNSDEYLPIVKVAPVYPAEAVARGLEGHVVVSYTVTANGSTENIEIRESTSSLFEQSAIESAGKYKYKPRIVDGAPVDVPGVTTRIVYQLANNEDVPAAPAAE